MDIVIIGMTLSDSTLKTYIREKTKIKFTGELIKREKKKLAMSHRNILSMRERKCLTDIEQIRNAIEKKKRSYTMTV